VAALSSGLPPLSAINITSLTAALQTPRDYSLLSTKEKKTNILIPFLNGTGPICYFLGTLAYNIAYLA